MPACGTRSTSTRQSKSRQTLHSSAQHLPLPRDLRPMPLATTAMPQQPPLSHTRARSVERRQRIVASSNAS